MRVFNDLISIDDAPIIEYELSSDGVEKLIDEMVGESEEMFTYINVNESTY